ncbi:hypothetical protein F4823DRAFT_558846 [Ustulina deusta]|nr:hypothetical protein F4823DRAFT_558846 [Ustulina deusta]
MPRATLANAMTGRRTHASNATTSRSVMIAGRNGYCTLQRLRQILDPKRNDHDHEKELQHNDDTTWFGVERDSSNQAIFQDHGRFTTLMTESHTSELGNRYPQLVSSIGQTEKDTDSISWSFLLMYAGAEKSTLIKMLINRLGMTLTDRNAAFPSPVTSSNNDRVPTTLGLNTLSTERAIEVSQVNGQGAPSGICSFGLFAVYAVLKETAMAAMAGQLDSPDSWRYILQRQI